MPVPVGHRGSRRGGAMSARRRLGTLVGGVAVAASSVALVLPQSEARPPSAGIVSVTPITEVYTYGQKVSAVAIEYAEAVDSRRVDETTFSVQDSIYNFRFNPIDDLPKLADRTITHIYTNRTPTVRADERSVPGRYVIVELDPADTGGSTVIQSKCPSFLCTVKVNPDLLTRVVQHRDVYARSPRGHGKGKVIARAAPSTPRRVTETPVNLLVDDFEHGSFLQNGMVLPYDYRLPEDYDPARRYPLVVVLPGHGMGWDGDNTGVQLAADIPATAWMQSKWTGRDEDVIVIAPQNQRVGAAAEGDLVLALLDRFTQDFSVDRSRVYATSVSYGSRLLWHMFAKRPELFAGGLVTGGFAIAEAQAQGIAAAEVPIWITHGVHDHLLNISLGRASNAALRRAYEALGNDPEAIARLLRYTEYDDAAFSQPDYHAAFGPTYEDPATLQWLLDRRKPAQEGDRR
jgi:predicted peptidase